MILVHYSDAAYLELEEKIHGGADEPGCFFYPAGKESEGWNRTRHEFYIPDEIAAKVVEEVQTFHPGEVSNDNEIVEVFVAAENFKHLVK